MYDLKIYAKRLMYDLMNETRGRKQKQKDKQEKKRKEKKNK